jgi:hypothetical protein
VYKVGLLITAFFLAAFFPSASNAQSITIPVQNTIPEVDGYLEIIGPTGALAFTIDARLDKNLYFRMATSFFPDSVARDKVNLTDESIRFRLLVHLGLFHAWRDGKWTYDIGPGVTFGPPGNKGLYTPPGVGLTFGFKYQYEKMFFGLSVTPTLADGKFYMLPGVRIGWRPFDDRNFR